MDAYQWKTRASRFHNWSWLPRLIIFLGSVSAIFIFTFWVHPGFRVSYLFICFANLYGFFLLNSLGYYFWEDKKPRHKKPDAPGLLSFAKLAAGHLFNKTLHELPTSAAVLMEKRNAILDVPPPEPTIAELETYRNGAKDFVRIGCWLGGLAVLFNWMAGALTGWLERVPSIDVPHVLLFFPLYVVLGGVYSFLAWHGVIGLPHLDVSE